MEQLATDEMIDNLINRLMRHGHLLPVGAIVKLHRVITEAMPDRRTEGNQSELAQFIRERIEREP